MNIVRFISFFLLLPAFSLLAQGGIAASAKPVQLGTWNSDLKAVLREARARHVPMMLVLENEGCSHCLRLMTALDGAAFNLWRQDRAILMAHIYNSRRKKNAITAKHIKKIIPFFQDSIKQNLPLVYVWWPKSDGTEVGKVFSGRRDMMGGDTHKFLSMEFMSAVDKALGEYLTATTNSHRTLEQILKECPRNISFSASVGGMVSMVPETGILPEGADVALTAKSDAGYVFLKWLDPNGVELNSPSNLTVTGSMPEGAYTAKFKSISAIKPPIPSPAATSICARVGEMIKYRVNIDEESRPVLFKAQRFRLPPGLQFDARLGVVSGIPRIPGTNVLDIAIIGSDMNHTVATNRLTFIVRPNLGSSMRRKKRPSSQTANDGAGLDDVSKQ